MTTLEALDSSITLNERCLEALRTALIVKSSMAPDHKDSLREVVLAARAEIARLHRARRAAQDAIDKAAWRASLAG